MAVLAPAILTLQFTAGVRKIVVHFIVPFMGLLAVAA
jgi:hypothetical protein